MYTLGHMRIDLPSVFHLQACNAMPAKYDFSVGIDLALIKFLLECSSKIMLRLLRGRGHACSRSLFLTSRS